MRRHSGGYVIVDHSASPGLPEEIARAAGYAPELCKEGKIFEADTMACAHCPNVVLRNPLRTRERHYCNKCEGRYICDPCAYLATLPDYVHICNHEVMDIFKDGKGLTGNWAVDQPLTLRAKE